MHQDVKARLARSKKGPFIALGMVVLGLVGGLVGWAYRLEPQRLLHLGNPLETRTGSEVALPAVTLTAGVPQKMKAVFSAAEVARLQIRAKGTAPFLSLGWKTAGDSGFPRFREIHFPLFPEDGERTYEVNLNDALFWNGQIRALRLLIDEGTLDIAEIRGEPATGPYRSLALGGETRPSLPGAGRLTFEVPPGLPRSTVFETHIGLLPEYDRPGVKARFQVAAEVDGESVPLTSETLAGGNGHGAKWAPVRARLPRGARHLQLSVEAARHGTRLPEGVGIWGDPLLVTPGRTAGKNLIVVLVDTLRADRLGAYGGRKGLTPNLDEFAAESVRFADMYSPAPWTLPSVSSLMTGLHPQAHGAGERLGSFAPVGLAGTARTMAEVLRDHGLYTVGVYHNIYVNPAFGLEQGFHEYASLESRAGVLVDDALGRLQRLSRDRRFFLYLHLFDPHTPYEPPIEDCERVARRLAPAFSRLSCHADRPPDLPPPPVEERPWYEALYDAEVAYTDRQVGRLLRGLEDMGLADDTVVAVVSDHGEEFWTRSAGTEKRGYDANSDHGHTLYEELLRVPALIRVPGRKPQVVAGPATLADLFPTLLSWIGIAPPASQGKDLTPRLAGPAGRPFLVTGSILHGPPRWSVQRDGWKLIVPEEPGLPVELYDLSRDPGERHDRAAYEPEVVKQLRSLGEREIAARHKARGQFFETGGATTAATYLRWNHITKLRSLGYLR